MGWVGVITDVGNAALQRCLMGEELDIDTVKTGTGTVATENMRSSTALVSQTGTGNVKRKELTDAGIRITCNVTPETNAYTMKEIGIFATIDGESVMIALCQNTTGIEIPAKASFPDFVYSFYGIWDVDNMDNLTITVNTNSILNSYQGVEHAGKFLMVDEDGYVTPILVPPAEEEEF